MEATTDTQVAIIERSTIVFQNAGQILLNNKSRSEKAVQVGRNILAEIREKGMSPELDQRAMKYLANCAGAGKEMKESRAEVTQIMDEIKKMYTALENDIDAKKDGTVPALIQEERNTYVRKCAEEDRKRREEQQRIADKAKEALNIRSNAAVALSGYFQNYLLKQKQNVSDRFNNATLDAIYEDPGQKRITYSIDEIEASLKGYSPVYKAEHYTAFNYTCSAIYHTAEEVNQIVAQVKSNDQLKEFSSNYIAEMSLHAQDILDKVPSKRAELIDAKRIVAEQAAEAERQRLAEEKRQEAIAKANVEQKKKLEAEAAIAREKEAERLKALKAEQEKADAEKKQREADDAARLQREADDSKAKAEQEAEIKRQGDQTMIMFDQEAAMSEAGPAPEARQGYDITVTHQAGYVQIFQFWFENEGKNLAIDKMGKTSLDQMKSFVEKHAHKQGRPNIDSKFLKYEPSYKAVNRKPSTK